MSESLRDQLTAALDKVESTTAPAEPVETPSEIVQETSTAETPAEPAKAGRTAGRARDEAGRLLPGAVKKDEQAVEKTPVLATQATPAAVPARPSLNRPSSWKKEYWPLWEKLTKGEALSADEAYKLAEYNLQRENDAAKGVSTYKTEFDRLKPWDDAVAPHRQLFQQHGIDPVQQFSKYVEIHKGLALGDPQQKLGMLMRIAQDYQIPLQQLFVQGQDGRVHFNPQVQAAQVQQPAQQQQQSDPRSVFREMLMEERANQDIEVMKADTNKYPHFEAVRQTMLGLLQGGLAQDLSSAYEAAIRLPQHSEIFEELQQQKRTQDEAERKAQEAKRVAAARANHVSPRTATPSAAPTGGKKGLRSSYEDALQEIDGRV